ncbi:MAG: hypothetical protein ABEJ67_04475 [Halanaeroarchaeum sp.]
MSRRIRNGFREMWDELWNFMDKWNILGLTAIIAIISVIWEQEITTQVLLVTFTAAYVFTSFNQMRETRLNRIHPDTLTVRPDFEWKDDDGEFVFGMRNFGTGPAINLRGCAVIREEEGKEASQVWQEGDERYILKFSDKSRHLSLQEDELLPLTAESPLINRNFDILFTDDGELKDSYRGKQVEFYYTFESNNGEQYPRGWGNPSDMELVEVIKKSNSPRTVALSEIEDKCA